MLDLADEHAGRADVLEWLVADRVWLSSSSAWLTGAPESGRPLRRSSCWSAPTGPARELQRGELLRYLRRLGYGVEPFPGCPDAYAAGLRGDWRAAAAAWERAG